MAKPKSVPEPPDPTINLNTQVDEPGKLFSVYRKKYRCKLLMGMIFLVGSLAIEVVIPFETGRLIQNIYDN